MLLQTAREQILLAMEYSKANHEGMHKTKEKINELIYKINEMHRMLADVDENVTLIYNHSPRLRKVKKADEDLKARIRIRKEQQTSLEKYIEENQEAQNENI